MTPFKKWFLRPMYIALYCLSGIIFGSLVAYVVIRLIDGLSFIQIYKETWDGLSLYALAYLGAYWVKWNFVYGPQKVTEVKNETNG